ncbi:MAG: hypothetical protein AAF517_17600 [Planctomycetota bacterium]
MTSRAILLLLVVCSSVAGNEQSSGERLGDLWISQSELDFGDCGQGEIPSGTVRIENRGEKTIRLNLRGSG